jgi:hypothetical protein
MASLAAARVLSDHFREIVIVERDCLPKAGPGSGRAAGQTRAWSSSQRAFGATMSACWF